MLSVVGWVHDARTPVTLVKSSLGELESEGNLSEVQRKRVAFAARNADKLLWALNKMLDEQKTESRPSALQLSQCTLSTYFEEKKSDWEIGASQKGLTMKLEVTDGVTPVWIDRVKMGRIVDNLLANALKYTEKGTVDIKVGTAGSCWTLQISDTGIGIPVNEQPHVFDAYYRAGNVLNAEGWGTGMGLALTADLVKQHQGRIDFTSVEGRGTTFNMTFPLKPEGGILPVEESSTTLPDTAEADADIPQIEAMDESRDKNVLLLAEDDADMCEYLRDALSGEYQVVCVPDGGKALERAREINPDIIISDVMMPVLKGDELCRILKSSLDTSHIPVILLTALSEREDIIYGLEAGANDYIIKPFDLSVLKARLRNVLQNRQRFRVALLSVEEPSDEVDYSSPLDKKFMDKVMNTISEEMDNPAFSVNDLCRKMGMSRTSMYNKMKTLTGQGPSDFIRIMRLNKGKELLATHCYSIGEISFMVGFSDPKYFSTCFKKQFGISPSKMQ